MILFYILSRDELPASILSNSFLLLSTLVSPAHFQLSLPIISHLSGSLALYIFQCNCAYSDLTVTDCFHQLVTIKGVFKQPTGFSISHLKHHDYARFIRTQPPVEAETNGEKGNEGTTNSKRMTSIVLIKCNFSWR